MKVVLQDVTKNREKWLEIRRKTIGSSEIAAAAGLDHKRRTPLKLWMEKTGRIQPDGENDAMRLGRVMEPFIGEKFGRDESKIVAHANVLLVHPVHECFSASPDFWTFPENTTKAILKKKKELHNFCDGIVECKNVNYHRAPEWADGRVPDAAQIQLQWQLAISGLSHGYVAGLVGASVYEFIRRPFAADPIIAEQLFETAHRFLELVKSDTPPPAVQADREHIEAEMQLKDKTVELPDSVIELLAQYENAYCERLRTEKSAKPIKEIEDGLRAQIERLMGDAALAVCGEYSIKAQRISVSAYTKPQSECVKFTVKKNGVAIK